MTTITNSAIIAFFDSVLSTVTPTANFTPVSGKPLLNLTGTRLTARCRTPDLSTDRQLTWDLGASTTAAVFALMGSNATLNATRQFQAADDSGFSAGVIQSGSGLTAAFDTTLGSGLMPVYTPPWGRTLIYVHPQSFSKRYIRWHQTDSSNSSGYQEWGVARLGMPWQPSIGFESATWRTPTKLVGTPGAEKMLRGHEITFHMLTKTEAYDLQALALTCLSTKRLLVIPEGTTPSTYLADALWATLENTYVREVLPNMAYSSKYYKVALTFREVER